MAPLQLLLLLALACESAAQFFQFQGGGGQGINLEDLMGGGFGGFPGGGGGGYEELPQEEEEEEVRVPPDGRGRPAARRPDTSCLRVLAGRSLREDGVAARGE